MDVWPAAWVTGGKDAGEADTAVRVGDLDTTEVVLVLDPGRVHGVATLPVTVPDVDRCPIERSGRAGHVGEPELECHGYPFGGAAGGTDAGSDVAAHDP